jgi:hypothetical protein
MFYRHLVLNDGQEEVLLLYIANNYEFSNDFLNINKDNHVYDKVSNYIRNKNISFNGHKVYLILNGLLVANLDIKKEIPRKISLNDLLNSRYTYSEIAKEFISLHNMIELIDNGQIYVIPK